MRQRHTDRGFDRIVAFSDGTVAIAITILALPLVDLAGEVSSADSLGEWLADNSGGLISFAVTFAVIANFWTVHHRVFEVLVDYDGWIVWVNFAWIAGIAVLPVSANLLARLEQDHSVYALYIGTMMWICVSLLIITLHARRRPVLLRDGDARLARPGRAVYVLVQLAIALPLALFVPGVGMWALAIFALGGPLQGVLARWIPALRPVPDGA